jgi:pimeloyl-ACP methyl ester carboxylesterase
MVREFPVFVPAGEEQLGAIITVPDQEARGLVVLFPGGGGAPRSHHFTMWTQVARGLGARGIASVRMDWRGVGDSTGVPRFGFKMLPIDDAVTVARFAMRATGIERLGMTGNCGGARTVLQAAASLPTCDSLVLILLKPLAHTRSRKPFVLKTKGLAKRFPFIERLSRRAYWRLRWRRANPLMEQLVALRGRADLLLMESDTEKAGKLPQLVASMQRQNGHHALEIRDLPGGSTRAFQDLGRQQFVIESVIDWFDRSFAIPQPNASGVLDTAERTL